VTMMEVLPKCSTRRTLAVVRGAVGGLAAIDLCRNLTTVEVEIIADDGDGVAPAADEVSSAGDVASIVVAARELPRTPQSPQRSPYREKHEGGTSALHWGKDSELCTEGTLSPP
jgi:hypothetical protein